MHDARHGTNAVADASQGNRNPKEDFMSNQSAEITPSVAHGLLSLIEVAPGAVVSRTISKTKGGTLTLFAFDVGEGLSEHAAPFDAFVQVLDGKLTLKIGGEPVEALPGTLVRMPANIPHALHAEAPTRMMLVMLRDPS
jgi:quercetin dioxygenase-like cupin family protein